MRRNANVGSMLFNKYGFAQTKSLKMSQKCGVTNCNSCVLKRSDCSMVDVDLNFTIKPSKSLTCKSECVIYVAICKLCRDFYFGKTMSQDYTRMNGHRDKFQPDRYDKSALAMHIYTDHPDSVGETPFEGLGNYEVILVETSSPEELRRREDYYIGSIVITQYSLSIFLNCVFMSFYCTEGLDIPNPRWAAFLC